MSENRRADDMRITRVEDKLDKMQEDVSLIKQKLYNGFSEKIEKQGEDIDCMKVTLSEVHAKTFRSDADRLSDCPLKNEVMKNMEKKFARTVAIIGVIIALLASMPSWLSLIWG